MDYLTLLPILETYLKSNKTKLHNFAYLILGVIQFRTVNIAKIANIDDGKNCSIESRYRRFQNFFYRFNLCYFSLTKLILSKVPKPPKGYILAMDRTNWKYGKTHINFLVLSVIASNVSIPLCWMLLPQLSKQGNSKPNHRKSLINRLLKHISASDIQVLLMDREFANVGWLKWLDEQEIGFIARIKKNTLIDGNRAEYLLRTRRINQNKRRNILGSEYFTYGKKRSNKKESILLVSSVFSGKKAGEMYKKRWGIERLFWHMKGKGFNLEKTHMTDPKKLELLFAVIALAFLFVFGWGCKRKIKRSKKSQALKRKSLFKLGHESIMETMIKSYKSKDRADDLAEITHWIHAETIPKIFVV